VLFEIADFGVMWFHGRVYEQDLPWIKVGDKAILTTPAAPGQEFEGTITLVDPSFDPATRSTRVRIEVPNPKIAGQSGLKRAIPHRAYGEARVRTAMAEAVLVPRSALLDTGERAVVYVDRGGGAYEKRDVKAGRRGDTEVEIVSGLAPGETVVVQGNLLIDAEAQMAQPQALGVGAGPAADAEHSIAPATLERWKVLSDAAAALAVDDLDAFNRTGAVPETAGSLAEARRAYYEAVTPAVAEALRHPGHVKVYECPMAGGAFPGAPDKARWLQMEPPLRNPWFGPAMSDCGVEVDS
jgi:Cu(I)/Ag(I) efflux system membrane fusion protein